MERHIELSEEAPLSEEAYADYDLSKERLQEANYKLDLEAGQLETISMYRADKHQSIPNSHLIFRP